MKKDIIAIGIIMALFGVLLIIKAPSPDIFESAMQTILGCCIIAVGIVMMLIGKDW